ncbi:hypothetical protein [Streptomyces camelliae]|uniref:PH domain-containing protein n=1 Tax=Streptomyces camelliae TaxID=3004093 RepID=A0ABY7PDI2_9ACTN|nr:hypothetical protein [Streptomyces sp. HUAS 2-6]WBO68675.1 hypothetical protein O1G22_40650 [Streptomyces sp. HUAS 2-6]
MGDTNAQVVLRPSTGNRRTVIALMVAGDLAFMALPIVVASTQSPTTVAVLAVFCALSMAVMTFLLLRLANSRVEIGPDRVLVHAFLPLKPFDMARADIVAVQRASGVRTGDFGIPYSRYYLPRLQLKGGRSIPVHALTSGTETQLEEQADRLEKALELCNS